MPNAIMRDLLEDIRQLTEDTNVILGTTSHDVLIGTDGDDILNGLSGYDTLDGAGGSDIYLVNADDFQDRYVDFYNDTGTSGFDVIQAVEAGVDIGIGTGFSLANGIEKIDGVENSRIIGDNDAQIWDFTGIEITGVNMIFGNGGHDQIRGTDGADTIDGGEGHDVLSGGKGKDVLLGGEGHDQIFGENGNDSITGGAGYDIMDGGEGADKYYIGLENAGFVDTYQDTGTKGKDKIIATEDNTVIGLMTGFSVANGIEVIHYGKNADVTIGGTNDSEIWNFQGVKLKGIQWINALDGHDQITANDQNNKINAGDGHDFVEGLGGKDYLIGGDGHDILLGGDGKDRLDGGSGNDMLNGGEDSDQYLFGLDSGSWTDLIMDTGTSGKDKIIATADGVTIALQSGFSSANGIEVITAKKHSDVSIIGSDQADVFDFTDVKLSKISEINAGEGMDIVHGSNGGDIILGEGGHDQLYGGNGRDKLYGGEDSDFLYGESGKDQLFGEAGNDILDGGTGKDILTGGEGYDIFVFREDSGTDTITDFELTKDLIDLSGFADPFSMEDLAMTEIDGGVKVDFGDSAVIVEDVSIEDLTEDMFIFG